MVEIMSTLSEVERSIWCANGLYDRRDVATMLMMLEVNTAWFSAK